MQTESPLYLSVVIPCYNEVKNIKAGAINKVFDFLTGQNYAWEIIVVDDGSSDQSVELVSEFIKSHPNVSVLKNPHQGKAYTVISGMLAGKGKIILFSDMDQATPISEVLKILPWFEKGYDVVIGSRSGERKGAPLSRIVMARGFMLLRSIILGLWQISDTQCGFKAFRREVAQNLFGRLKIYGQKKTSVEGAMVAAGFDVETLFLAAKLGYKIKEVSVQWVYKETKRVGAIRDSYLGLRDIITVRINDLRGLYDSR